MGGVERKDERLGPALSRYVKVVRGRGEGFVEAGESSAALAKLRTVGKNKGLGEVWRGAWRHRSLDALDAIVGDGLRKERKREGSVYYDIESG